MRPDLAALVALAAAGAGAGAGCAVGTRAGNFAPAKGPAGVVATIETRPRRALLEGEVLAVRDSGLVLLVARRLTFVPYAAIDRGRFHQLPGSTRIERGRPPDREAQERIRLVSRYPQGLTPGLEAELLAAYGQTTLEVIPP